MSNNKGRAQQLRQTEAYRQNRRLYEQRPDVKAHKAALRQIKKNLGINPVKKY